MRPDHNMDELRNRYPDVDFFEQEGNGAAMSYPNENAFRAWATQYNEVTIHHALALRSISYRLVALPDYRRSRCRIRSSIYRINEITSAHEWPSACVCVVKPCYLLIYYLS